MKKVKEYNHIKVEKKWQKFWENKKIYEANNPSSQKLRRARKFYGLIEFPYPSGAGLHVGHIRSNTAMDIISRKRRMEGYNVLYPIGWDAFGLPTENYAIKTGKQPERVTKENTDMFRKQLKSLGFSFDWSREVNTTDPAYYKWTQWIFLQMYKKGLAYKTKTTINWCPKDKIGLANEEVVGGMCERCGSPVEKREKEQWMLAITKYAERLDKDLDDVNYLEKIKIQQRNWIGRSVGSEIDFKIKNSDEKIKVFTTRADTLFGASAVVLAPEHELVNKLIKNDKLRITNKEEVLKYIEQAKKKDDVERTAEDKEKTGVELKGVKAINPGSNEEISIWIADYVLNTYGTGAVMSVPAHDERDFSFAKKYNLPIKNVLEQIVHVTTGEDAVRPNVPTKKKDAIFAIVKHWSENKYLCIKWKNAPWANFLTGGIEEGEDHKTAAVREVEEESGYCDVKNVKDLNAFVHAEFYHPIKKINQSVRFHAFYIELASDKSKGQSDSEKELHTLNWIPKDEVENFISVINGKYLWRKFLGIEPEYYHGEGMLINSGKYSGMESEEARKLITKDVGGKMVIKYKLRDWVFSRQRYWGEPIPLIKCADCGWVPVPEKQLPVTLPKVKSYQPTDNGESPLANIKSWVNVKCPKCKGPATRETDTMPNWAGSSWYFLRYVDPKNKNKFANKNTLKYWMKNGVDWYNGGMEHTTLHLLYSRFWHKFLYDLKLVPTKEPYMKRTSHGMILAEGGEKMSKSKGNTVNPDDLVKMYGADTIRLYEMFIGPFDQAVSWSTDSMVGPRRFIERIWRLGDKVASSKQKVVSKKNHSASLEIILHKTIKKVTEDIESMNFNTAISSMMILLNEMEKQVASSNEQVVSKEEFKMFLQILAPFAPHVSEELWNIMGGNNSIHKSPWPKYNPKKLVSDTVKIVVQVNGKVRAELNIDADANEDSVKAMALKDKAILGWIEGKEVKRVIYVAGRLVNIVV